MKTLKSLCSKIVLVKQNQIPLGKLTNPKYIDELRKLFKFGGVNILQDQSGATSGLNFVHGLYIKGTGKEIVVEHLTIESRKIGFQIEGSSDDADSFYNKLKKFLADLVDFKHDGLLDPVVAVYETELVSVLSFSVEKLFSETFLRQINENLLSKVSSNIAKARLGVAVANFQIDYEPSDFGLIADNRITINRKEFTIQIAPGYGISDKVYATKAPLDTNTHMLFLKDLEKAFTH